MMGAWSTAIFGDDLSCDVRDEYMALLSLGRESEEAERVLMDYYAEILGKGDPDEPVFWLGLAYIEWRKGRLSSFVRDRALHIIDSGEDLKRWAGDPKDYRERKKVLEKLKATLQSPMPPKKKIRKAVAHHSPWPVGSLLAYRIQTDQEMKDHPLFMKYALIRVLWIMKHPVSSILEDECYDESLVVGLYGWAGSEIPDPEIVEKLEYIPIQKSFTPKPKREVDDSMLEGLSDELKQGLRNFLNNAGKEEIVTYVNLIWDGQRGIAKDIITYLDCDRAYEAEIPKFFKNSDGSMIIKEFRGFDYDLCQALLPYAASADEQTEV